MHFDLELHDRHFTSESSTRGPAWGTGRRQLGQLAGLRSGEW